MKKTSTIDTSISRLGLLVEKSISLTIPFLKKENPPDKLSFVIGEETIELCAYHASTDFGPDMPGFSRVVSTASWFSLSDDDVKEVLSSDRDRDSKKMEMEQFAACSPSCPLVFVELPQPQKFRTLGTVQCEKKVKDGSRRCRNRTSDPSGICHIHRK